MENEVIAAAVTTVRVVLAVIFWLCVFFWGLLGSVLLAMGVFVAIMAIMDKEERK